MRLPCFKITREWWRKLRNLTWYLWADEWIVKALSTLDIYMTKRNLPLAKSFGFSVTQSQTVSGFTIQKIESKEQVSKEQETKEQWKS